MKLKMLSSQNGSSDGFNVVRYAKGEVYDLPDSLAEVFLKQRWARRVPAGRGVKDAGAAPENKARSSTRGKRHGA